MREWKKNFRKEDILTAREIDRTNRRIWVKRNPEKAKKYMSAYFKEWLKDPINNKSHGIRTRISCLKHYLKTHPKCVLKENNKVLYENLKKIGWTIHIPKNKVVNHIISVKLLLEFNFDLDMDIISNYHNLEICDKTINSRAVKRTINKKIIAVAHRMEKEFPEQLKGLGKHIESLEGATI